MVIKCVLSVPAESIKYYARQFLELPPLPEYISKKGPYVNNREGSPHQIITLYHFNKFKLTESQEIISNHLGSLRGLPGYTLSAHIYGPRPYHLILEKGGEIKKCPSLNPTVGHVPVSMTA